MFSGESSSTQERFNTSPSTSHVTEHPYSPISCTFTVSSSSCAIAVGITNRETNRVISACFIVISLPCRSAFRAADGAPGPRTVAFVPPDAFYPNPRFLVAVAGPRTAAAVPISASAVEPVRGGPWSPSGNPAVARRRAHRIRPWRSLVAVCRPRTATSATTGATRRPALSRCGARAVRGRRTVRGAGDRRINPPRTRGTGARRGCRRRWAAPPARRVPHPPP